VSTTYRIDFHIPVKEIEPSRGYILEGPHALTVEQMLTALSERFVNVRLLMRYGRNGKPPVAVLVDGRTLALADIIPDGAIVRIVGAVAGG